MISGSQHRNIAAMENARLGRIARRIIGVVYQDKYAAMDARQLRLRLQQLRFAEIVNAARERIAATMIVFAELVMHV
jgi:hypothetical protein